MSTINDLLGLPSNPFEPSAEDRAKRGVASLRKLLKQAVDGERRALRRAEEAEASVVSIRKRAQNNIDRAFNRGVRAAGGGSTVCRIVRHPELGKD